MQTVTGSCSSRVSLTGVKIPQLTSNFGYGTQSAQSCTISILNLELDNSKSTKPRCTNKDKFFISVLMTSFICVGKAKLASEHCDDLTDVFKLDIGQSSN